MKTYKFRSPAQLGFALDIIKNNRLRCSPWNDLNDPMEGMYIYSYGRENEVNAKKIVEGIGNSKNKYRICSLSQTYDCHLLWAHYADGFRGIAIEIELPNNSPSIRPVKYRGVFAGVNINSVTNEDEAAKSILFSKNAEWEYEKEVRVLSEGEWYELPKPVQRVIVGSRMSDVNREMIELICEKYDVEMCQVGIGDEGIDADRVRPRRGLQPRRA